MSFHSHGRCDWCEAVLPCDEGDEMLDEGWMLLEVGAAGDKFDFCCLPCLAKWAKSDGAAERVAEAMNVQEDE